MNVFNAYLEKECKETYKERDTDTNEKIYIYVTSVYVI